MNISAGRGLTIIVLVTIFMLAGGIYYMNRERMAGVETVDAAPVPPGGARELFAALEAGDPAEVTRLLSEFPDLLNYRFGQEGSCLHVAARRNDVAMVNLLLEKGADPKMRGQWSGTALHWASWWGSKAVVEELLKRGFEIEDKGDDFGSTPLLWACHGSTNQRYVQGDYAGTVNLLIEKGAAADTANAEGMPAAMVASQELREILRAHGAKVPGMPVSPDGGGGGDGGSTTRPTAPVGPMV
jgi:hypothetical protein